MNLTCTPLFLLLRYCRSLPVGHVTPVISCRSRLGLLLPLILLNLCPVASRLLPLLLLLPPYLFEPVGLLLLLNPLILLLPVAPLLPRTCLNLSLRWTC
ncbi:hypothetical protein CW304_05300 [Bacillus sp. UFRGS-B20]|nr:hypothetical protein CW304_05300 [Bacillus sp. UFRGS-B20]